MLIANRGNLPRKRAPHQLKKLTATTTIPYGSRLIRYGMSRMARNATVERR
jgi:hypothetical protein